MLHVTVIFIALPILCLAGILFCIKLYGRYKKIYQVLCSKHGYTFEYPTIKGCEQFIDLMNDQPEQNGITPDCRMIIKSKYVKDE